MTYDVAGEVGELAPFSEVCLWGLDPGEEMFCSSDCMDCWQEEFGPEMNKM